MIRPRILVIDKDPRFLALMDSLLGEEIELRGAGGCAEGLSACRSWAPDLIVLDLSRPRLGGVETLNKLEGGSGTAEIPVLVVSAVRHDAPLRQGIEARGNVRGYLDKLHPAGLLAEQAGRLAWASALDKLTVGEG